MALHISPLAIISISISAHFLCQVPIPCSSFILPSFVARNTNAASRFVPTSLNVLDTLIRGDEEMGENDEPENEIPWSPSSGEVEEEGFTSELSNIASIPGVGWIESTGGIPTNRYLVPLTPSPQTKKKSDDDEEEEDDSSLPKMPPRYVMVDVPPFSEELVERITSFISKGGKMSDDETNKDSKKKTTTPTKEVDTEAPLNPEHAPIAILITNKGSVHYDDPKGVYTVRKSDLNLWTEAFPDISVVMHRHDILRDLRPYVTQVLDGYGPWGYNETSGEFDEMGRKLTLLDWDDEKISEVYGEDENDDDDKEVQVEKATANAMKEAGFDSDEIIDVRANEEGKQILAVYTPGHTLGSVSYVMPQAQVCCSGNTIPDYRARPRLDDEGLVTTNQGGLMRQVESATQLAESYTDRCKFVLPSKSEIMLLEGDTQKERKEYLQEIIDQFGKTAKLYANLGIISR